MGGVKGRWKNGWGGSVSIVPLLLLEGFEDVATSRAGARVLFGANGSVSTGCTGSGGEKSGC